MPKDSDDVQTFPHSLSSLSLSTTATESIHSQHLHIPEPSNDSVRELLQQLDHALSESVRLRLESLPSQSDPKASSVSFSRHKHVAVPSHPSLSSSLISSSLSVPPAHVAVLFSGGLDCMVLAGYIACHMDSSSSCCVDLLNVAFENPRSTAAISSASKVKGTSKLKKKRKGKDEQVDVNDGKCISKDGLNNKENEENLDEHSTQILCHHNPYDVPDRLTGRSGLKELQKRYPHMKWRLVEVDVPYEEALRERAKVLKLMNPLDSVMDLVEFLYFFFIHVTNPQGRV